MARHVGAVHHIVAVVCAVASLGVYPVGGILFSRGSRVPRSVQQFAWQVLQTRCNYQSYELAQRSFWAYDVRARHTEVAAEYDISILSDVSWKKTEPPAMIEMTVADGAGIQLVALRSTVVTCTLR